MPRGPYAAVLQARPARSGGLRNRLSTPRGEAPGGLMLRRCSSAAILRGVVATALAASMRAVARLARAHRKIEVFAEVVRAEWAAVARWALRGAVRWATRGAPVVASLAAAPVVASFAAASPGSPGPFLVLAATLQILDLPLLLLDTPLLGLISLLWGTVLVAFALIFLGRGLAVRPERLALLVGGRVLHERERVFVRAAEADYFDRFVSGLTSHDQVRDFLLHPCELY